MGGEHGCVGVVPADLAEENLATITQRRASRDELRDHLELIPLVVCAGVIGGVSAKADCAGCPDGILRNYPGGADLKRDRRLARSARDGLSAER